MLRIGGVPYGVGATLLAGIPPVGEGESATLVVDAPARLVESLRRGELDAALASSIEAFRRPGYRVDSELAICSCGPVRSVRAFVRHDVTAVSTFGLDTSSETSVALLRILLERNAVPGLTLGEPRYDRVEPTTEVDALPHDIVLMIGECGLYANPTTRRPLDLGELWHAYTGLPFVFAVWLISADADLDELLPVLHEARRLGGELAIDDGTGGAVYYDMTDREIEGLLRFRDEAVELGLAERDASPEFVQPEHTGER